MSVYVGLRRFKCFFGVSPQVCAIVWDECYNKLPNGAEPKHLLWCLFFLKQYQPEHVRRVILKADEKTIRKWTWSLITLLSDMNVVNIASKLL